MQIVERGPLFLTEVKKAKKKRIEEKEGA